jgi:hypothetical protein
MSFITKGLRSLCSAIILPGVGMIAMGLGVIPVDQDLLSVATAVIGNDLVPLQPFFLVLGSTKVLGVLGLWDIGPFAGTVMAYAAVAIPAACALYGHSQLDDGKAIGAGLYLCCLVAMYFTSGKSSTSKGKEE